MAFKKFKHLNYSKYLQNGIENTYLKNFLNGQVRRVTYSLEYTEQQLKPDWNRAVSDAEKVVGYPTSYLTLRSLLSDEMSHMFVYFRKMIGTSHPLLKTAKRLIYNGKNNLQTRGLIILLISKAMADVNIDHVNQDTTTGVLRSQRSLAEISEMIHTAQLIHKAVVNLTPSMYQDASTYTDLVFGNKIAILSGDYLLANACTALASLNHSQVVELISSSISDFMESELIGDRDSQDNPLPSTQFTLEEWEAKNMLCVGSLMANSCQGSMLLSGQCEEHQKSASEFGRNLALAWQAHNELQPFLDIYRHPLGNHFDLTSLPLIYFMQKQPHLILDHVKQANYEYEKCDFEKLQKMVVNDGSSVTEAMVRCHKYADRALTIIHQLNESEAKSALQNLIYAMKEI